MKSSNKQNRIWISWERHRRTLELSEAFNAKLFVIDIKGIPIYSYVISSYKTFIVIRTERPQILFVQNPSMVLSAWACLLKPFFKYKLVVDRHTNFKFEFRNSRKLKWLIFRCLSRYTIRQADLTIITNKYLRLLVSKMGGVAFILPDKLPKIPNKKIILDDKTTYSSLFICTFSSDEPYKAVFEAARRNPDITLYVTGKHEKYLKQMEIKLIPKNVRLLGFVSDIDYFKFLNSVDFTIVLTSQEFTLNCGAYESVATGKPMVLSGTNTIRKYFSAGATYVNHNDFNSESMSLAISEMVLGLDFYKEDVSKLSTSITVSWKKAFRLIDQFLIKI